MRLHGRFVQLGALLVLVAVGVLASSVSAFAETKTETFLATGGSEQSFAVPVGVTRVTVAAIGGKGAPGNTCAGGHTYPGGAGAKVAATLAVSEAKPLYIHFGGGGAGGAADLCLPAGGEGGGASDVRTEGSNLKSRLVVAGGGGGGGSNYQYAPAGCIEAGSGGSADALEGEAGTNATTGLIGDCRTNPGDLFLQATGGGGGRENTGGKGGSYVGEGTRCRGGDGSEGRGGDGFGGGAEVNCVGGGGGGGGYWGGGGGGGSNNGGGGGGAGSSYYAPGATNTSVAADTTDPQEVLITYTVPKATCTTNSGTIKLSPGLTSTPAVQTVKIKGTLSGCTGDPFTTVAYTATLKTAVAVSCSVLKGAGEPASGAATYKWTPKAKPSKATGTLGMLLTETPAVALSGAVTAGSYSPLTLSGTATESFTGGATCGEKVGKKAAKPVKAGTFSGSAVSFE